MRAHFAALFVASVASVVACAAPPAVSKMQSDTKIMNEERSADKLLERGRAFASIGDLTRAEQYLSGALNAGGDEATILPLLLRVCVEAKRFRVAIDYAEPVLRKHPRNRELRFLVASLHASLGDDTDARRELEEVIAADPKAPDVHFALAELLRDKLGERLTADTHFREYLRLSPEGAHAEEARASLLKVVP